MDFRPVMDSFGFLMSGLLMTGKLTGLAVAGGTVGGIGLAVARLSYARPVHYAAMAIVESVRATPVLMLIFWFYFLMPRIIGQAVDAELAAILTLIIFNSAYTAEIIRAGIQAIPTGQVEAARSTGLRSWQLFRHIVLPQAFENMTPAFINQIVSVYKTTSLVYVIGVVEFFRAATIVSNREFRPYEVYAAVAIVYFVPSTISSRISRVLEKRRVQRRA